MRYVDDELVSECKRTGVWIEFPFPDCGWLTATFDLDIYHPNSGAATFGERVQPPVRDPRGRMMMEAMKLNRAPHGYEAI